MAESISLAAKMTKNVIKLSTSLHRIGPKIVDGTLRKKLVEPPWRCPKGYFCMPIRMEKFQMEILTPPEAGNREMILQLHGGGYLGKIRNAYRDLAVLYSEMPGHRSVLSVDYRVAPEDPYPAALQDALAAYQWLLEMGYQGNQIILAGDSAGGGLALALALYLRDNHYPLPKKMVLMSPWTDLTASGPSYETNYEADPLFGNTRESMIYSGAYYQNDNPRNPYISPVFGEYNGLPPMLFQVGSIEMLLSDSVMAAKKAKLAGCQVKLSIYEGMFHVFQLGMHKLKESAEAWAEVEEFLTEKNKNILDY